MINLNSLTTILQEQFPEIYQEESENLIAFVRAYYEWLEASDWGQTKNLLEYRDIDTTLDEFVDFFKNKYLANISSVVNGDVRNFIKHADDFYDVRGTEEGVRLLFQLLYSADASVYKPSTDILKASDGEWFAPIYLEVTQTDKTRTFLHKTITGGSSGATAYVDSIVTKTSNGKYYSVYYISAVNGNFQTSELITVDGSVEGCPSVIGSLNNITITDGGRDASIGDIYSVTSSSGAHGLARVANTYNGTGRVSFSVEDGGTGYSLNALSIVSSNVFTVSSVTSSFIPFETVEQKLASVNFLSANANFTVGDNVIGYTSGTWVKQANGIVVKVTQTGANGNIVVAASDLTSEFAFADTVRKAGNTITANISNTASVTATGNVVSSNVTSVGVHSVTNEFYMVAGSRIRGTTSNCYANITAFSTGAGADFNIGSITDTDTIFINSDIVGARNSANVPFMHVKLNGEGSGIGIVDSIQPGRVLTVSSLNGTFANGDIVSQSNGTAITATGNVYASNATSVSVFTQSGTFVTSNTIYTATANAVTSVITIAGGTSYVNNQALTFTGGGESITSVTIANAGTGYANGERLVFTSNTGQGASAILTTNATGSIVSVTFANTGQYYSIPPVITINTTSGTSANLVAVLNSNTHAVATVTTNSTGGILSFTVTSPGSRYFYKPTATIPTGTGAVFQINMDYGYGFVKNPQGVYDSKLNSLLTRYSTTIGTIASITGVAPGLGYNHNPFARAVEPAIAAFGKKDYVINTGNTAGSFVVGEIVRQTSNVVLKELAFTGIAGNSAFDVGEVITQANASGVVYYKDATVLRLSNVSGTFVNTSNSTTTILGSVSNATANVASTTNYTQDTTAKGVVKSFANDTLVLHRLTFNNEFIANSNIVGLTSGTSTVATTVSTDYSSEGMGNNAIIPAIVRTANGIVSEIEIISSGFGYLQDDTLTLTSNTNQYNLSGRSILARQGIGQGYWKSTKGFLNSDKFIHDGYYYQAYSYEIQSGISLSKYSDIVKKLLHVSGTELFGKVKLEASYQADTTTDSLITSEQTFTISSNYNPLDIPEYTSGNTIVATISTAGANVSLNIVYKSTMSNTFVYMSNANILTNNTAAYNNGNVTNFTVYSKYDPGVLITSTTIPTRVTSVGRMHYNDNSDVLPLILGF